MHCYLFVCSSRSWPIAHSSHFSLFCASEPGHPILAAALVLVALLALVTLGDHDDAADFGGRDNNDDDAGGMSPAPRRPAMAACCLRHCSRPLPPPAADAHARRSSLPSPSRGTAAPLAPGGPTRWCSQPMQRSRRPARRSATADAVTTVAGAVTNARLRRPGRHWAPAPSGGGPPTGARGARGGGGAFVTRPGGPSVRCPRRGQR